MKATVLSWWDDFYLNAKKEFCKDMAVSFRCYVKRYVWRDN